MSTPTLSTLSTIPTKLTELYASMTTLPPIDPTDIASLTQLKLTEPGKREWETSKTGYLNWAVGQLLAKTRRKEEEEEGTARSPVLDDITARAADVGTAVDMRRAMDRAMGIEDVSMLVQEGYGVNMEE